jgi:hypothetical protein
MSLPGRLFDILHPILNNVNYIMSDIGVFKMLNGELYPFTR